MKKQLLFLMALLISLIGYTQSFNVADSYGNLISYNITSANTVSVQVGSTINNINVEIPETVVNSGTTYTVTGVNGSALGQKNISNITLPNTITNIGSHALASNNLTTITLPNSLITIGNQAFSGNDLTGIVFPNSLTTIGDYCFQNNQLGGNLIIPENVSNIGAGAFRTNPILTVTSLAIIPPTIVTLVNNPNDTFHQTGATYLSGDRSDVDLFIPSGTMGAYVTDAGALWTGFNSVTELLGVGDTFVVDYITYEITSLTPSNVEVIGYDTAGGTAVSIPASVNYNNTSYAVKSIKNQAFQAKGLTEATIANGIESIGSYAFLQNSLGNIVIPSSVTNIELGTFENNALASVTIPNSVTSIGLGAFKTNNLTSVILPESVTSISSQAFRGNPLVSVISLATTPPAITTGGTSDSFSSNRSNINLVITNNTTDEYVTDNGALWTGFKMVFEATSPTTVEVSNYDPANGTSVVIPADITAGSVVFDVIKINDSVFENIGLTSVTIPDGVEEIGISAFELNNLTSVTIPDSVTLIGTTAFAQNSISNLSLGANVTDIGIGAFIDNSLSDVTIPSNVTFIGLLAFSNNPLTDVTSLSTTPPTITTGTNDTFAFNRGNIHLHIPAGTMGVYVTDAGALWTGFNPVTEDALSTSDYELANDIKIITTTGGIEVVTSNNARLENYSIYNISGAKVTSGETNQIATTTFASGIYILKLDFDRGSVIKKVIIN